MKEALSKIKDALSTKDVVPHMTHYVFSGGELLAQNGRMMAGVPYEHDFECLVPADKLDAFLSNVAGEFKMKYSPDDQKLYLSGGKLKARIQTLAVDDFQVARPEGQEYDPPPNMLQVIKTLSPFVSKNATHAWSVAILFQGNQAYATNMTSLARVEPTDWTGPDLILPSWACDYLTTRGEMPSNMMISEFSCSFIWPDGSWMRTQLVEGVWPDKIKGMIDESPAPEHEVDTDLREAFKIAAVFDGERIELAEGKILSGEGSNTVVEVAANLTVGIGSVWAPAVLGPVLEIATKWSPDVYPDPVPWDGSSKEGDLLIEGIIMGRSK